MANVAGYLTPRAAMADTKMGVTTARDCDSRPCDNPTLSVASLKMETCVVVSESPRSPETSSSSQSRLVPSQFAGFPRKKLYVPMGG